MINPGITASLRRGLRVTGLAAMFMLLTAYQCLTQSSDIQYAAGYGYVVKVECSGCRHADYYVLFDTYQQAQTWLDNWKDRFDYFSNRVTPNFPPGYKKFYDNTDEEYDAITPLLGPPPNSYTPATPVLNQPQPFTPQ